MESSTAKRRIKVESPTEIPAQRPHVSIAQVIAERLALIEGNQTKSAEALFAALKLMEASVTAKISEAVESLVQRITNLEETCSAHLQMMIISNLQRDVRKRMIELDLHWNLENEIADAGNRLLARELLKEMKKVERFQEKPRNSKKLIAEAIRLNLMKEKARYEQAKQKERKSQNPYKPSRNPANEENVLLLGLQAGEYSGHALKYENNAKLGKPLLANSDELDGVVEPSGVEPSSMKISESNVKAQKRKRKQTVRADISTNGKTEKRKFISKNVGSRARNNVLGKPADKQKLDSKADDPSLTRKLAMNKKPDFKTDIRKVKNVESIKSNNLEKLKQNSGRDSRAVSKPSLSKSVKCNGKADKNKLKNRSLMGSSVAHTSSEKDVNAAHLLREIDSRHKLEIISLERTLIEKVHRKESTSSILNPSLQTGSPGLEREKIRKRENKRDEYDVSIELKRRKK